MNSILNFFKFILVILMLLSSKAASNTLNKIEIIGNDRISDETIKLFISLDKNKAINDVELNNILKELYKTNFFKNITVNYKNQILFINVEENPIIENIFFNGVKSQRILELIQKDSLIKSRSSFNENILKKEKLKIENTLKSLGFFDSSLKIFIEKFPNNLVSITYDIELGKKSKIKKISFIGKKIFKDKKLRRIITSEEYKFWKFISGRKYLNQNNVSFDERLLRNFYKNSGYYNVKINSSFAKLIDPNSFELIFNINSGEKVFLII